MIERRDPFREPDDAAVVFELRSSPYFVAGMVVMLIIGPVLVGLGLWMLRDSPSSKFLGAFAALVGLAVPFAMWSSRPTYTVPGGRAQLRLYDDRIELVSDRDTTVIGVADLRTHVIQHRTRVMAAHIETDRHLVIATSGQRITLSRRVFASDAAFERAAASVHALATGALLEERPPQQAAQSQDDGYRRRLREELDAMARE